MPHSSSRLRSSPVRSSRSSPLSNTNHRRNHAKHSTSARPHQNSSVPIHSSSPRAPSTENLSTPHRSSSSSHHPHTPKRRRTDNSSNLAGSEPDESSNHSSSGDEDELERLSQDKDRGAKRKIQKRGTDPLATAGRHFTRVCDMWTRFTRILEEGLAHAHHKDDPEFTVSEDQQAYISLYQQLRSLSPFHLDHAIGKDGVASVASFLETRRISVRGEDVKLLKDKAQRLRPLHKAFVPSLDGDDKATRGFHHPQLARFLCPIGWLDRFDKDTDFRQKLIDGVRKPRSLDWPLLLFDEDTFDPDNLMNSFMKNIMLIRGWRMIFNGPSSVNGFTNPKNTKRGCAFMNGMKSVTANALAYVATLVYFALSAQTTFSGGSDQQKGDFNFFKFYYGLVASIDKDLSENERQDLFQWWNKQVFLSTDESETDESDGEAAPTGRSLLKAQLQARRNRALCDQTNIPGNNTSGTQQ